MMEKEVCNMRSRGSLMTGENYRHIRKTNNENPYNIMFAESGRKTTKKFHGNGFQRKRGHW
jgi:hypothetical protein